ncbi:MAG: beta-lactamase family protein [Bacteroidetes bacterium]|nr:beta-lactamase family protein [Bacteroidota bacterium]
MTLIKKIIPLIFIALVSFSCQESKKEKKELIAQLDSIMTSAYKPDEPGASVLVFKEGEILLKKGYGLANLEMKVPINPKSVFNIGSITKQFTAQAILLLGEQGKLSLTDPIQKYLPDYPHADKKITIENLLTHTSGIIDVFEVSQWFSMWEKELTPQQFVDVFKDIPLLSEPGTQYHYSNVNYGILGLIIENISGESHKDFLIENFFKPIGMNNTYILKNNDKIENTAMGYFKANESIENAPTINYSHLLAAGSIWSCTDDMVKWYEWLSEKYKSNDPKIKKALTRYILADGSETNNGYGMMLYLLQGCPVAGNNGSMLGYTNYTLWLYEDDIVVVLLSNYRYEGTDPDLTAAYDVTARAKKLAETVMGKTSVTANFITLPENELDKYTGVYKIEENAFRIITRKGNQLYSKRSGSSKKAMNPITQTLFQTTDGSNIEFVFNEKGEAVEANWRQPDGTLSIAQRTDIPLPEEKKPVVITDDEYKAVCGLYKMMVVFNVNVYMNDRNSIIVESKQRGKSVFYPESPTKFFLKDDDDIVIDFLKNKQGVVNEFKMTTGGRTFSAKKAD